MFQQNQDIFNTLAEALSEGIVMVDTSQKIVAINSSTNEIFGYADQELIGQPLDILIPKNYHSVHDKHVENYIKRSKKRQMAQGSDLFGLRKCGSTFPVEVGLNPLAIYGNNYVLALVKDITEQKKIEKDLKHWATIFDESLNEIYIFDAKSLLFVNVNRGALQNMGYSLEELRKLTPVDIKPSFTKKEFKQVIAPLLNNEDEKIVFDTIHRRKDQSEYDVEVHLQLSSYEDKPVFVAIILDITDRRNYTKKLEQTVEERTEELKEALLKEKDLNELKTKFLSLVSHEFKTPLSGILTSATLLSKYKLEEQQLNRDKHIKTITDKVHYLNNILNDFLSIEKLEKGKVNYQNNTFKVSKVVNEVVYNANMLLKEGQKINYPKDIDEFSMYQDEKIIELALSNLVHNAIKYSSENSTVDIDLKQDENFTFFQVKDNGIGIPEKDQENIFNRYFRAENALLSQGTGIGLNIVKHHLENLGGTISFSSKEGKGSTFIFKIPNKAIDEKSIVN